jgi:hypothetical protein
MKPPNFGSSAALKDNLKHQTEGQFKTLLVQ